MKHGINNRTAKLDMTDNNFGTQYILIYHNLEHKYDIRGTNELLQVNQQLQTLNYIIYFIVL